MIVGSISLLDFELDRNRLLNSDGLESESSTIRFLTPNGLSLPILLPATIASVGNVNNNVMQGGGGDRHFLTPCMRLVVKPLFSVTEGKARGPNISNFSRRQIKMLQYQNIKLPLPLTN